MGDTHNTANTTSHHTMKRVLVIAASLALVWGAPQFLTDTIRSNCRSEVTTVFEETETETVNKVICQTEFKEECNTKVSEVCRNVTTGEAECKVVEEFVCVDSVTNKCGIEKVLKNVSYTETVCQNKLENICEKESVDGATQPVEGSCATKPVEVCEEMTRFQEEFVNKIGAEIFQLKTARTFSLRFAVNSKNWSVSPSNLKTVRSFHTRSASISWRKYLRKSVRRSRKWSAMRVKRRRRNPLK